MGAPWRSRYARHPPGSDTEASHSRRLAGLMSQQPIVEVRAGLDKLLDVAREELGSRLHDPFMAMSFMALEVIPSLKLTDVGLVDVDQFVVVDLFV